VGKGSCFRFDLLLKPTAEVIDLEQRASRRIVGLEPGRESSRILVVDDEPANRALLCQLLRPVGFEVAEAGSGLEALEVFEQWAPQAILMDMRMPGMDGYQTTRRIKSTEAGRATAVIALTASAFEDSKQQVMAAGVDAYIRKPFQAEELFETLGKCLGLSYVFADETDKIASYKQPASLIAEALYALPQELVRAMRQALEDCDIAHLTELIAQVEKLDSPTARGLQALADSYDYPKLSQWLGVNDE